MLSHKTHRSHYAKITKAKISKENLMDYIHEDRDLLMGLQDDLSDMLSATGNFLSLLMR